MRDKGRAARSDIHGRDWFSEAGTAGVRSECFRVVFAIAGLVNEGEGDSSTEGPHEDVIVVSLHDDEEQRDVRAAPDAVAIQVAASTQLVAIATGVERRRVERRDAHFLGVPESLREDTDLPQQHAVVSWRLHELWAEVKLLDAALQQRNFFISTHVWLEHLGSCLFNLPNTSFNGRKILLW